MTTSDCEPRSSVGADVVFLFDVERWRNQHLLDSQPLDVHPQDAARDLAGLGSILRELDAARLAASADVDLRLDDDGNAELLCDALSLFWGRGDLPGCTGTPNRRRMSFAWYS